jgi:hypothetical protein
MTNSPGLLASTAPRADDELYVGWALFNLPKYIRKTVLNAVKKKLRRNFLLKLTQKKNK